MVVVVTVVLISELKNDGSFSKLVLMEGMRVKNMFWMLWTIPHSFGTSHLKGSSMEALSERVWSWWAGL